MLVLDFGCFGDLQIRETQLVKFPQTSRTLASGTLPVPSIAEKGFSARATVFSPLRIGVLSFHSSWLLWLEKQFLLSVSVVGPFCVCVYLPSASCTPSTVTSDTFPYSEDSFFDNYPGLDGGKQRMFKGIKAREVFVYSAQC